MMRNVARKRTLSKLMSFGRRDTFVFVSRRGLDHSCSRSLLIPPASGSWWMGGSNPTNANLKRGLGLVVTR